ncbi:hypothetical protein M011DRAFT_410288 [Sporormia fimetaria CBS 119925]|uniref:Wax synthase domain-containing protein n=1 Tax=Sporormia fimetaria CBS 119925 TaxID=1340428 RepID=A0A6A6V0N0_9PLEO|nr:hypothetical protein M011DRAFT_410288 [Sporormia fimetaria CBS 119925]
MILLLHILIYFCVYATALPTLNQTSSTQQPPTVGWVSTPQVRGTFDLLLSSLTTLLLCAWTAYHPNVLCSRGVWRQLLHRSIWMAIAIFLPELVLFCAWEQWWAMKRLKRVVNNLGAAAFEEPGPNPSAFSDSNECNICPQKTRRHKTQESWTSEQTFFALSGGFAVDSSAFSPVPRVSFTLPGLLLLAKLGLLPEESPESVSDKSKADYAAKAFVCCQAGWFLISCIARLAQKLPVTLLEYHVLAHVVCLFGLYLIWLEKPYDVGSPILFAQPSNLHVDGLRFEGFSHNTTINEYTTPISDLTSALNGSTDSFLRHTMLAFLVLCPIYGAIHLAAWSSLFPSEVERWMWCASGLIITAPPFTFGGLFLMIHMWKDNKKDAVKDVLFQKGEHEGKSVGRWKKVKLWIMLLGFWAWNGIGHVMCAVWLCSTVLPVVATYPAARLFVVGEAFAQLRSVDREVYRTVEWTGFIPHLG